MATASLDNQNSVTQCECSSCEIDKIKNLDEDFRMTPCPIVAHVCKTIRKLLKKGFVVKPATQRQKITNGGEYFDEFVTREELINTLTHTLNLWHPNRKSYIKFILARYRTCVGVHDLYRTSGFYVSDNKSMALLRFKTNKKLSCYFIDFTTNEMKSTDILIDLVDKEMCSIYLYNGSLWIIQNTEIGVINVAYVRLKDNPVKCFVRNFGTMDYWNPFSTRKVAFTDTELHHEFLHVTLDTKRTKVIRKHISTIKNSFFIPVGDRQIVIYYDAPTQEIMLEISVKEEKVKVIKTIIMKRRFELSNYSFAFSDISNMVVVRINKNDVIVVDVINCCILKFIALDSQYDLNRKLQFMFSANGKRVYVLGAKKDSDNEYYWTQHLLIGMKTLKQIASRVVRERFTVEELKKLDVPKTLKHELNLGRL